MKPLVYKKRRRVRHAPPVRQKLHVTKGDIVQLISGDERASGDGCSGCSPRPVG